MRIQVMRGTANKQNFYMGTMKLWQIYRLFLYDRITEILRDDRIGRKTIEDEGGGEISVDEIVPEPLVLAIDESAMRRRWHKIDNAPDPIQNSDVLCLSEDTPVYPVGGIQRISRMIRILLKHPELAEEQIPVVFVPGEYANRLSCDSRDCVFNNLGLCRFHAVKGYFPEITDEDGCTDYICQK